MTKQFIIAFALLILISTQIFSQAGVIKDADTKKQYLKAISKANSLFDNGQYTASIHFYKKAQNIAPEKKLAKFRLEDIITIFIKKEIASTRAEAEKIIEEIEAKSIEIEKSLQTDNVDTLAMMLSKINASAPLEPLNMDMPDEWKKIEQDVRNEMQQTGNIPEFIDDNKKEKTEPESNAKITTETKTVAADTSTVKTPVEQKMDKDTIEAIKKDLPLIKPVPKKEVKPKKKAYAKLVEEKRQRDDELMKKYPDGKTVEIIKTKNKTVTRTIIRKDNKVTVYLKVKHSWGGEYYFIDNSPIKIQSITKHLYETSVNNNQ